MSSIVHTKIRPNIGIFASEDEALKGLVERLVSALDPQSIWLFGSRARGTHRPDSDFDLFVVGKQDADWAEDYTYVYMTTSDTLVGADIVPCSSEDFEIGQLLPTTLVSQVLTHGRKVFENKAH
jgi:uncharacterized protein